MQRKLLFIVAVLLLQLVSEAQLRVSSLRKERHDGLFLSFPLVRGSAKTVYRINSYLQSEMLSNDSVVYDSNRVFKQVEFISEDSLSQSGYTQLDYHVELNSPTIFSVLFDGESMGAYSYGFFRYFNFNSTNGELLSAKDLFTPAAIVKIKQLLINEREKKIKAWIAELTQDNGNEDSASILERFLECNERAGENDFLIKKNSILFHRETCFPHSSQVYNTNLDIELSYAKIAPYLNESGKRLLRLKR